LQRRVADRKIRLPIIGPAKLTAEPVGYYPSDEWCAPLLTLNLQLFAPSKTLTFRGRIPDLFSQGQMLVCTIGEASETARFSPGDFDWSVPLVMPGGAQVSVQVHASASMCPARDQVGAKDKRDLAYHLYAIEVV
jgi:hypothetical protein